MVLGRTIFSGYITLAIIVTFMRFVLRSSGAQMLFGGLKSFYCLDPKSAGGKQSKPDESLSKKARKAAEQQRQLEIQGAAQQIYCAPMTSKSLLTLPFADDITVVVTMGLSIVFNAVYVLLVAVLAGSADTLITISTTLLLVPYTAYVVLKADLVSTSRKLLDWVVLGVILAVGATAAFLMLTWAPKQHVRVMVAGGGTERVPLLTWDAAKAAHGFDVMANAMLQRISQRMKQDINIQAETSPTVLALGVSMLAGTLAVSLLAPALQYARTLYGSQQVPEWGKAYLTQSNLGIKAMQLAFVMPLILTISQVPALVRWWGLPVSCLPITAGVLLLMLAVAHTLAIRPLCQAYLNKGLVEWYQLLYNGYDFPGKLDVIRVRLDLLRKMAGKVGLQLLGPPLISASLGLMLLFNSGLTERLAAGTQPHRLAAYSKLPAGIATVLINATCDSSGQAGSDAGRMLTLHNISSTARNTAAGNMTGVPMGALLPDLAGQVASSGVAAPHSQAQPVREGEADKDDGGLEGLTEDGSTLSITRHHDSRGEGGSHHHEGAPNGSVRHGDPRDLWVFVSSFLGWWSSLAWSTYALCSMTVYRLGLNMG